MWTQLQSAPKCAFIRHVRCTLILLALVFFTPFISKHSVAQGHKLVLESVVPAYGGSCKPGVLAGSMFTLHLRNTADRLLRKLSPGWPEGYTLEAALDLQSGQPFAPTPGLIERFQPTPFFTLNNLHQESKLLSGDSAHVQKSDLNKKNFAIRIPSDLAGHTVTIHAFYHHGDVNLETKPYPQEQPISIIAPCDRADTARIVASWVFAAWASNDTDRVIALADSMLACDLSDAIAWNYAYTTALRLELYEKALAYFERMYQDFGVTNVDDKLGSASVPKLNRDGPRDPVQQQRYERYRNGLLRQIAREEQQQPQK
jgi:hypothetical protein